MSLVIKINGTDRTSLIDKNSFTKTDVINQQVDTAKFAIRNHSGQSITPNVNDTVKIINSSLTIFNGVILSVRKISEGHSIIRYEVESVDNSHLLTRVLVNEKYEDETIEDIIDDVISNYASDFTTTNVVADIEVKSITFNRLSVAGCLAKLASASNYSWYVDSNKDIHFFEKNTKSAPFNLTDDSANYIFDSIELREDISQLKNRVFIRGGEAVGLSRTENFDGDGTKKFFKLANKFSELPTVTVGGAAQTVGVDFLDNENDFDVLWNFNEQYLKWKTAPVSGTNNIDVSGTPLYSIITQVDDVVSIAKYGLNEFSKTDKTIKSKEESKAFAIAELNAYSEKISEGSFSSYTDGLQSGQIININSTLRSTNEDFLIQSVRCEIINEDKFIYFVRLATLKTVSIIDFLIGQLREGNRIIEDRDDETLDRTVNAPETITIEEAFEVSNSHNPQDENVTINESSTVQDLDYEIEFVVGEQSPNGTKRQFILNSSLLH